MASETTIQLRPCFFTEAEKTLVEHGGLKASIFLYETGVHALRVANELGHVVALPFQGQQIWRAEFLGRQLTMRSMFEQPRPTRDYMNTYGAFAIHCGATAMGVPTERDDHPVHGELPNAPYQTAQLLVGEDERGAYFGITGTYRHTVAFRHNYVARPLIKLRADSSLFELSMDVENLKRSEMELMYLAHVNFRPVDDGRLVYSAPCDADSVRIRTSVPSHIRPPEGYMDFIEELRTNPGKHHLLKPGLGFDPEVVFFIDYQADDQGWAHSMQVHSDGSADLVSHRPDELEHAIRWISRTPDQDCLGIILPATAEPEGYSMEKEKGNLKVLPPGATFHCQMEVGALTPNEAKAMEKKIADILAKSE